MKGRMLPHSRAVRIILWPALFIGFTALGPRATAAGGVGGAKLVSADRGRIVFEIEVDAYRFEPSRAVEGSERLVIPSYGTFSRPGEPMIPARAYLVAIPPEGAFSVRFTTLEAVPLGRHRLEPVPFPELIRDEAGEISTTSRFEIVDSLYYGAGETIRVFAEDAVRIRHTRVLPIRVIPVAYDPTSGELLLATSIRVEVSFPGRRREGPFEVRPERSRPESPAWENIFGRVLVNPKRAAEWSVLPRGPRSVPSGANLRAVDALSGPLVKLKVKESALHRVKASGVVAKGFPAGEAISSLHLFKRVYDGIAMADTIADVRYHIVEDPSGTPGVFDGSDELIFYGQRLRDDGLQGDPVEKFSDHNVYWLGTASGPAMPRRSAPPGFVSADTAAATFPVNDYIEEDNTFIEQTPPGIKDFYYYNFPLVSSYSAPFAVGAIKPGGSLQLRAEFLGGTTTSLREVKLSIINSKGRTQLTSTFVPQKSVVVYSSGPIPASAVSEGLNTLLIEPSAERSAIEVSLRWLTLEYESLYKAKGNALVFNTGALSSDTTLAITRLTSTDVMLFDITNPSMPAVYELTAGNFKTAGGGFVLSFRESLGSQRRYALSSRVGIREIRDTDIVRDNPSNLIGNPMESGIDILVISQSSFLGEIQSWVTYRRAQNYRVLLADVEDIYDEFNGGVLHPRAIKNFIRYYFERANASFVLLVGDGSEDNKRVHSDSGISFVPSESYSEHIFGGGFNEDEVVTSDKWYVFMDNDDLDDPRGDFYPDLIIGRIPAGTPEELRVVLDKIATYEKPKATDFWRRRMLRVADDAWSYQSDFRSCYRPQEIGFEQAEARASDVTEASIPGGFDVVRFFLSDRIGHPPIGTCVWGSVQTNLTRANATPALLSEINKGATIVSLQAHMNRYQVCHEWLLTSSTSLDGTRDYHKFNNFGRPFILYGMGCHLSDYALHREFAREIQNGPNGDCFSELALFRINSGAVATYGSSGFEYLNENLWYTPVIADVFFNNPPRDTMVADNRAQARWIFGELMTVAEIEDLNRFRLTGQVKRYHILGDPLLRIDGGPPRFDVRVNGKPFDSGDLAFAGSGGDTIEVVAVVTDEVAVEKFTLEIDGKDASVDLAPPVPLVDENLSAARKYEVRFRHKLLPKTYDVILRAHQAADTAGGYSMAAEFLIKVESNVSLRVNGRPVFSGDVVPAKGDYVFELKFPAFVPSSLIRVVVNGDTLPQPTFTHPTPEDSTTWLVSFSQDLPDGKHTIVVVVGNGKFTTTVYVSSNPGLRDVIAYPNPFRRDTYFVYTNDIEISNGSIDIYTASGKKVARLDIPPNARAPGQNAVHWNGRDRAGDGIANGVYLFVISIDQGGRRNTTRGKIVHIE